VPKIYSNNDDDSISSVDEEGQKGQVSTVTRKDLDAAIEGMCFTVSSFVFQLLRFDTHLLFVVS
jgi:hypothetical protein